MAKGKKKSRRQGIVSKLGGQGEAAAAAVIPEPSTLAMGLIALGAFALIRRRRERQAG